MYGVRPRTLLGNSSLNAMLNAQYRRSVCRNTRPGVSWAGTAVLCLATAALVALTACSARQYKRAADREVYGIVGDAEKKVHGKETGFNIDTPYSKRAPKEIKAGEIIADRIQDGRKFLSLEDALRIAIGNSRAYQTRKETLYLSGLALTRQRYEFGPQLFGTSTGSLNRNSDKTQDARLKSPVGVDQLLKTGAQLSGAIANDITSFYVGSHTRSAVSAMSVKLTQPLLRGAGSAIVAETLTQAERNVIYEVRGFSRFQTTFALDNVVVPYLRLLQQKDTVRNQYNSYQNAIKSRELSEALGFDGRVSRVQVDQARQRELDSRGAYLLAVERYRDVLDTYKSTLSLPLGVELQPDDKAIDDFKAMGLDPVEVTEKDAYPPAVQQRLDLINEIDRFEDAQRKVKVFANALLPDLNLVSTASIDSRNPDYTKFDWDNYRTSVGLTLNLPLDRLKERNDYRASFITFERQLRTLAQSLDDLRNDVRQGIRGLQLARETYEVQRRSVELANQRVESSDMLFQAGRVQIRDLLDAQDAQVRAQNAFTQALIDYHATRLGLLRDLGVLNADDEKFWLKSYPLPKGTGEGAPVLAAKPGGEVVTPEKLFGNE